MTDSERVKKVGVSYSWDSQAHKDWVRRLANALHAEPDIDVTVDQFDLWAGKDLTHFMEDAIAACERIVVIGTPAYVKKARLRKGGVGYECSIITAELARDQSQDKFIPVVREGDRVPLFLSSKLRVDAREPRPFGEVTVDILRAIRREPAAARPEKRKDAAPARPQQPYSAREQLRRRLRIEQFTVALDPEGTYVHVWNMDYSPAVNVRVTVKIGWDEEDYSEYPMVLPKMQCAIRTRLLPTFTPEVFDSEYEPGDPLYVGTVFVEADTSKLQRYEIEATPVEGGLRYTLH